MNLKKITFENKVDNLNVNDNEKNKYFLAENANQIKEVVNSSVDVLNGNNFVSVAVEQTITGNKTFSGKISGTEPTDSNNLTTKNYVDNAIGSINFLKKVTGKISKISRFNSRFTGGYNYDVNLIDLEVDVDASVVNQLISIKLQSTQQKIIPMQFYPTSSNKLAIQLITNNFLGKNYINNAIVEIAYL